jgi:arylsulfatase A-like enzyme
MKAIMIMFDSLNRRMLPPYGCDFVHAPNFTRLSEHAVTFNNSYVASMPCMPARRELHTGRYNFLHRSWGPLEPFDDSMPELLKDNGIYAHLVSDHGHYWEDGGCTYHTRYNSWEISRGQEGDPWKGEVKDPEIPEHLGQLSRQDVVNRKYLTSEEMQPQAVTFKLGMEFIKKNVNEDNWFLQLETFDPHEPFFTQQKYKDLYPHKYEGKHFDWPTYGEVTETKEEVEHLRYENAALVSMCDEYLGKVLDLMDELNLWKDTMLIVNTDHGFLLGEHDSWAKCVQPFYNEVAHTPLFIWDPRCARKAVFCDCLVQTIDIAPTLLDFFGTVIPKDMEGKPLKDTIANDKPIREAALFGMHGGHVNCTDGRYVYMRASVNPDNRPLYNYTLMPTHMRERFSTEELQDIALQEPFQFTKDCRVMKINAGEWVNPHSLGTMLFDLKTDPHQLHPIKDDKIEKMMISHMVRLMKQNDAPKEQFQRLGLD